MKAAITARRANIQAALTDTRKDFRKAEKAKDWNDAKRYDAEVDRLESLISFYTAAARPVQFSNGFVLNSTLLEQFVKKLPKGFQLTATFTDDAKLEIKHKSGKLTLYDLSKFYSDLKMSKGEVFLDGLGIDIN